MCPPRAYALLKTLCSQCGQVNFLARVLYSLIIALFLGLLIILLEEDEISLEPETISFVS